MWESWWWRRTERTEPFLSVSFKLKEDQKGGMYDWHKWVRLEYFVLRWKLVGQVIEWCEPNWGMWKTPHIHSSISTLHSSSKYLTFNLFQSFTKPMFHTTKTTITQMTYKFTNKYKMKSSKKVTFLINYYYWSKKLYIHLFFCCNFLMYL